MVILAPTSEMWRTSLRILAYFGRNALAISFTQKVSLHFSYMDRIQELWISSMSVIAVIAALSLLTIVAITGTSRDAHMDIHE